MPRFKSVDGVRRQMTAEEEAQRDSDEEQAVIDAQTEADAETNRINKKASGKQKLRDLGLDDDEIKSLMGV
jgi:hypothetical protein